MIVFVDPFNHGLSHVPINVAMVETAVAAEPHERLMVVAEQVHLNAMAELIDRATWERSEVTPLIPPPAGSRFLARLATDFQNFRRIFAVVPSGSTLVVGDIAPATIYALRLNTFLRPAAFSHVLVVLHGNASDLAGWRARNPVIRLTQLRSAMRVAPARAGFVVLEEAIRRALLDVVPEFSGRIHTFEHPLPSIEGGLITGPTGPSRMGDQPVRIAFLGAAQAKKGFPLFLDIAGRLKQRFAGRVEFHCIGWLPPESAGVDVSALTRLPSPTKISRAAFRAALAAVDYVCMPYSQDQYRYSASGTLLDAAAAGKPIIALRSPIFDDLEERFGDIGALCDRVDDLEPMMADLVREGLSARYVAQTEAMMRIRESRLPTNKVHQWRAMLSGGG
jgi:glycosyltransferase involved in cell wall biosynthesis